MFKEGFKPATYADIEALAPHQIGELISGILYTHARPAGPHAHAATVLGMDLGSPFQRGRGGPGGWYFLVEPELHLKSDVLVPDLAAWRGQRLEAQLSHAYFSIAPDFVCEVLSPSTQGLDRVKKMSVYLREGVQHVWLLDPLERTLETYRNIGAEWTRPASYMGDDKARAEPFSEIELDLAALWVPSP